jgi:RNA polymerase sigma-70 factor (ECF subfamily)
MSDGETFAAELEPHRRELFLHCYRFTGSAHDAEDVVQETLLRAWRARDSYRGEASLRTWLFRIATRACLDALDRPDRRSRRHLPPDLRGPADPIKPYEPPTDEPLWFEPIPDDLLADVQADPAARYTTRESVTLAFMAALHALPPRGRAVLILRDVLAWHAAEVAELLEMTVPAVNSALHRARTTLAARYHPAGSAGVPAAAPADPAIARLLERYVRAWETADVALLVATLRADARLLMPPSPSWYAGRAAIHAFAATHLFDPRFGHRFRLEPTRANGEAAFVVHDGDATMGLQVVSVGRGGLAAIVVFLDPGLAAEFSTAATVDFPRPRS